MLNKLIGPVLVGLLIASAVFNLWASVRYYFTLREIYRLQDWESYITRTLGSARALAGDAVRYGEQNHAIEPILQSFDLKPKPGGSPATSAPPVNPSR